MEVLWFFDIMRTGAQMINAKHNIIVYILVLFLALTAAEPLCAMSFAADQVSDGSSDCKKLLAQTAVDFAALPGKVAPDILGLPITRREVYRIKIGSRVPRKERKRRGGYKRYFQIYKIKKGDRVYKQIAGRSYKPDGSVKLSDLRYLRTLYYDFDGKVRAGELIVNHSIAKDTLAVFRELFEMKYHIRKMRLVDNYFSKSKKPTWSAAAATAADTASMNDDNTSCFNYRMVAGTSSISRHGYGRAIDVNPFENPWCPGGKVYSNQIKSAAYSNRANRRDHMIYSDSKITQIFRKHGFRWLGAAWTRDYQHFEK